MIVQSRWKCSDCARSRAKSIYVLTSPEDNEGAEEGSDEFANKEEELKTSPVAAARNPTSTEKTAPEAVGESQSQLRERQESGNSMADERSIPGESRKEVV
eukprot:397083-Hanusia_phi.AAC.3